MTTTELELRLEARIEEAKPQRIYLESWSDCRHSEMRVLGELGAVKLWECGECGVVLGVAR